MHATLRKMFRWAKSRDDLKHAPSDEGDAPRPLNPRSRLLSDVELAAAWLATASLPKYYASLFRLLILTGQRRGEVAGLYWSELDRALAQWILPDDRSKNRRSHVIPLSSRVIDELDLIAEGDQWPQTGLVLPSECGTPLSGFSKIKKI
jgi:integrase